ncbi:hypothetical protein PI93_011800 [Pandoraea fibrosis]|uniref:Uncharacterized protein n=1 Tax=Pandoraea fibrosis TaxID=1891094 RepID=A0ABX6HRV8_9BURK|nr:hypothetical protein [Pandoraea fibrosis]QHE93197.1 hypothetical protein PJ20_016200 [Pandoraea fibrosis]QHF13244.1 hypothetical protein PI93_011800 [Pandoraea fibrosis]
MAFAQGNNCDCQQYVGSCEAAINVVPTSATKGSYGAELQIRSTAPQCSKVDYYVDGTPYFTILSQGNQAEDRIFGQKPLSRANVSGVSCRLCRRTDASVPSQGGAPTSATLAIAGRWHAPACPGAAGWWGSGGAPRDVTVSLALNGTMVSGTLNEHSADYSYSASLSGSLSSGTAKLTSSVGSTHDMTLSSDQQTLTDRWCNKDGGCEACQMTRQ